MKRINLTKTNFMKEFDPKTDITVSSDGNFIEVEGKKIPFTTDIEIEDMFELDDNTIIDLAIEYLNALDTDACIVPDAEEIDVMGLVMYNSRYGLMLDEVSVREIITIGAITGVFDAETFNEINEWLNDIFPQEEKPTLNLFTLGGVAEQLGISIDTVHKELVKRDVLIRHISGGYAYSSSMFALGMVINAINPETGQQLTFLNDLGCTYIKALLS